MNRRNFLASSIACVATAALPIPTVARPKLPPGTFRMLNQFTELVGKGYGAEWRGFIFTNNNALFDHVTRCGAYQLGSVWVSTIHKRVEFRTGEVLFFRPMKTRDDYATTCGFSAPFIGWQHRPTLEMKRLTMAIWRTHSPDVPMRYVVAGD